MYSKLNAKQLAKAASSKARQDVYRIVANMYGTTSDVRCYILGEPVFATMTREYPGEWAQWKFHPTEEEGVYKIENVGLRNFISVRGDGVLIVDNRHPAEFRVEPAEDGFVLIKLKGEDKVWSLTDSSVRKEVFLEGANGSLEQKFTQIPAEVDE